MCIRDREYYALELDNENPLTLNDGLALVEGKVNESKKAKIARPEQAPTDYTAYWVVPVSYTHLDVYKRQLKILSSSLSMVPALANSSVSA